MYNLLINRKKAVEYSLLMLLCISLYFISKKSYILFHTTTEMATIALGFTLMLMALGTIKICENNFFHFLAIIFGFISLIDLFHVLTYGGMNIFSKNPNMSLQFNIVAKYYECIMLILLITYIDKTSNFLKIFSINAVVVISLISSIVILRNFPACYIEGKGLTNFHQVSEYLFSVCFLSILYLVIRSKADALKENRFDLIVSIIFSILSCLSFTLYNGVYGVFSFLGHLLKILSYYYGFKVIFKCIIVNPYSILFKKLNDKVKELENVNKELIKVNYKAQTIEALHEKYINLIPDGILVVRDKKIESANDRFLSMLEIDDEKKLTNMSFSQIIDSSYHEIFASRINNSDKSILERPQQYEFVWGEKRKWVEVTSLVVDDESGEYIISTVRNIEDRKKAEDAEQLLELKKKEDNMKNEFFTNISHELKTPINVIYSALQVENDYLKNNNDKELVIRYNKIIRQNCLRLMRLINNIIDVTRIDTNFFKPNFRIENIISVIEDITISIINYTKSKKIELTFDTEIEEAYVRCDSELIEKIMLNIFSNAVKYGKDNGTIEVYIYQNGLDKVSISVKDNGIGIPNEMKDKIFDRFLKVDSSLSRKTEGSGIGLSLVKELVEIHQGTISFNSQLNSGTEFIITLPTIESFSEVCATIEKPINYKKNIIESAEIEFSDIYD